MTPRPTRGKFNVAHTGAGGLPHLTGELFIVRSGANMTGVPYRSGGEAVTAVLSGAVHATFESITILLPLIREGKVRALAITSSQRTPLAPDLPTMAEAGVANYEVTTFNGIVAPAGTPANVVAMLNVAMNEGLSTPEMKATIAQARRRFAARLAGRFRGLHRCPAQQVEGRRQVGEHQGGEFGVVALARRRRLISGSSVSVSMNAIRSSAPDR